MSNIKIKYSDICSDNYDQLVRTMFGCIEEFNSRDDIEVLSVSHSITNTFSNSKYTTMYEASWIILYRKL
jgi:hypothetical protein